jgi:hypothetical protein
MLFPPDTVLVKVPVAVASLYAVAYDIITIPDPPAAPLAEVFPPPPPPVLVLPAVGEMLLLLSPPLPPPPVPTPTGIDKYELPPPPPA